MTAPSIRSKKGILILTVTILVSGLGFLMNSAVTIALPQIQEAFDSGISEVQWIANTYILALGSLILLSGVLGDIFGLKKVFTLGIGLFTLGTLLCAAAWNAGSLIAFRGVKGIGAALMIPGSLAVINRTFAKSDRGKAIGLWAGVSGAIAALGPFFGGILAEISWRLVFAAAVPLGAAASILALRFLPKLPGEKKPIDWTGAVLVFISLSSLSYGFITIGEHGFTLFVGIALGISVIGLAGFVLREKAYMSPLVPPKMFHQNVTVANIATFFQYFAFQGIFFLLSFRLQQYNGYSSQAAGLALLPATGLIALFSGPSGAVTDKFGPRFQMALGPLLVVLGAAWWIIRRGGNYAADILPGTILMGTGMVLIIPAITKTALDVKEKYSGAASGLNNGISRIAGLVAIAAAGSVLAAVYASALDRAFLESGISSRVSEEIIKTADRLLAAELPESISAGSLETVNSIRQQSFFRGFQWAMGILGGAAFAAGMVSLFGLKGQEETG